MPIKITPPLLLLLVQHVNDFVLPSTIDTAEYNDLRRVLKALEGFHPYNVGAMDGAATPLGRLDILQRLYVVRDGGCSSAAFHRCGVQRPCGGVGVVLHYRFYPRLRRRLQELTEATKNGHLDV
ncbi:uncharacterized protein IUM83_02546 [Phytophthora cinnamomi]|uniref:uncharacterized protein n=1 Tax=Phytophthora cinnamomi TaxID=4785 RepID=UPI00355A96E3|nr:hypothetical protein IUM83_02546 [Phytophthora cinnamomi]